jgi:hypothetical protein
MSAGSIGLRPAAGLAQVSAVNRKTKDGPPDVLLPAVAVATARSLARSQAVVTMIALHGPDSHVTCELASRRPGG